MLHVTHSFLRAPTPPALRPWKRAPVPRRRPVSSDGASSLAFGKDKPSIAGERAANDKTYEFSKISSKHPTLAPEDAPPGRPPSEGETLSEANTRWARPPPGDSKPRASRRRTPLDRSSSRSMPRTRLTPRAASTNAPPFRGSPLQTTVTFDDAESHDRVVSLTRRAPCRGLLSRTSETSPSRRSSPSLSSSH